MDSPRPARKLSHRIVSLLAAVGMTAAASAFTLQDLKNDQALTPHTFAKRFSKFKFEFAAPVQAPEDFIARKAGDCDDYATLASAELAARGYTPRLIAVRMKKEVHVVCYVAEANGYLDYNYRSRGNGLVKCGGDIDEIADSVSRYFKAPWTTASEFTYGEGVKRLVSTVRSQKLASNTNTKP